jgi:hypothetical protein
MKPKDGAVVAIVVILLLAGSAFILNSHSFSIDARQVKIPDTTASLGYGYILVGGQEGSWFSKSQIPRLLKIDLGTNSTTSLIPVTGDGTVWTGGSNSSDWLISG